MKKSNKIILFVIGGMILVCVLCVVFTFFMSRTPQAIAVATQQAGTMTAVPIRTIVPTNTAVLTNNTPQPSPTKTILKLSMYQFAIKYFNLTELQRSDFQKEYIGQWVDWTGRISDVGSFLGSITIEIGVPLDYQTAALVSLSGIPKETAISLSKGQTIHFTGRLRDIYYFISPVISVADVQIKP